MFHISFLIQALRTHIIYESTPNNACGEFLHLRILTPLEAVQPHTLYLTDFYGWKAYCEQHSCISASTFLFSGSRIPGNLPADSNFIITDYLQSVLMNRIQKLFEAHSEFLATAQSAVLECSSITDFLNYLAPQYGAELFLLDESRQVICSSLNANVMHLINAADKHQGLFSERFSSPEHELLEIILITADTPALDFPSLMPRLASLLQILLTKSASRPALAQEQCDTALRHILSRHTQSKSHPDIAAVIFPQQINGFISCIVIPVGHIVNRLKIYSMIDELHNIFPDCNIGVYQRNIVIIHTQPDRPINGPSWNQERFLNFLTAADCYAGISNTTRSLDMIRTLYLNALSTVQLSISMLLSGSDERIFFQKENSILPMLNLCVAQFKKVYGHQDLIYLTHPAIINLNRYDQKHHSQLVDVLFYYLLNNKNISKTAQKLYMHRNTALNKLNKIQELTGISLNDGNQQFNLLLSCYIIKYCQTVLKIFPAS